MTSYEISIPGDELEQHRIALEHNLQHTDLSLHLSSDHYHDDDDDDDEDHSSVEYPRHNSGPSSARFPDFASFDQHSLDMDAHSNLHAWSYRTGDDDEDGISPYGAETLSTAAHHASALTLSAGLAGRGGGRRDISLSGAEYDPDRPLQDMIAGVDSRFSALDLDPSRSKSNAAVALNFDPLVVDDSAELDRVLRSGQSAPPQPIISRFRSPHSSASSSTSSDSEHHQRPKLSDALQRVAFSPKRPRSAQSMRERSGIRSDRPASPLVRSASPLARPVSPVVDLNPTPKPVRKRHQIFPSYGPDKPQVQVQPPTPSTAGSQFTKMARGLAREIEIEQSRWGEHEHDHNHEPEPVAQSTVRGHDHVHGRNALVDIVNHDHDHVPMRRKAVVGGKTPRGGRVHLPDVTGLTSAVESPLKAGLAHLAYDGEDGEGPREAEARLLATLSAVQTKLMHLESENGISRRRVRELERELEVCKTEVARERTRVMEREEEVVRQRHEERHRDEREAMRKGKQRARDEEREQDKSVRYKEVVEEKKALEALITTLRTHLSRLTAELSSHQQLLAELRALRDADQRTLRDKAQEVDRLREEVERLAGEVEVLRGVVEEGLRERRMIREESRVFMEHEDEREDEDEGNGTGDTELIGDEPEEEEVDEYAPDAESSRPRSPDLTYVTERTTQPRVSAPDRTTRTDHATLGSSHVATGNGPFVSAEELDRISVELEERRSDRSHSRRSISASFQSQSPTPVMQRRGGGRSVSGGSSHHPDESRHIVAPDPPVRNASPAFVGGLGPPPLHRHARTRPGSPQPSQPPSSSSRPSAPTPARSKSTRDAAAVETPFPQIRGGHLERLFFSAPEHNAKTCTVCHRRRRHHPSGSPSAMDQPTSWLPGRRRARVEDAFDDDDEGFAEGSDDADREAVERALREAKGKGRQHDHVTFAENPAKKNTEQDRLPPQTVLARVLRELEDDFTHYKSIYVELADQYNLMDAASNVPKRNILAQHLREVIDVLEQKGDQIASLYDLLTFKDKHVSESVVPPKPARSAPVPETSWGRSRGLKKHPTFA